MSQVRLPSFEQADIGHSLDDLPIAALNLLPYGVVKLTSEGRVLLFSEREGELSGFLPEKALGQHWLVDVAPCMDSAFFREQLATAAGKTVDVHFTSLGDFLNPVGKLKMRLVSSRQPALCWLLISRD